MVKKVSIGPWEYVPEGKSGFVDVVGRRGDTEILINFGSGPVFGGRKKCADKNIEILLEDVGIDGLRFRKLEGKNYLYEGRHTYSVYRGRKKVIIDMPGLPTKVVRYTGEEGQHIGMFPRLFIDGSSYVWKFIVEILQEEFNPKKSAN